MTIQEAAHKLLTEIGDWTSPYKLAALALQRGMVHSNAKDQEQSLATTILKNIRDGAYNYPKLCTKGSPKLIGLPAWMDRPNDKSKAEAYMREIESSKSRISVELPTKLLLKIEFARSAGIGVSLDDTIINLLNLGYKAESAKIKNAVLDQLDSFDGNS